MTRTTPYTLRWGILSTGQIATEFTEVSNHRARLIQYDSR